MSWIISKGKSGGGTNRQGPTLRQGRRSFKREDSGGNVVPPLVRIAGPDNERAAAGLNHDSVPPPSAACRQSPTRFRWRVFSLTQPRPLDCC